MQLFSIYFCVIDDFNNIRKKSFMFGDNNAVVSGSMTPHAKICKRHTALSFYRVREAIVAKIVSYHLMKGMINPADALSKHWCHSKIWPAFKSLLLWQGNTMDCFEDEKSS